MPLQSGNAILQGIQRGLGVVNAAQGNPLAEAQLAFQMRQHSDGQEYRDALTRESNVRAEAGEMALDQQRQTKLQQDFDRLNFSAQQFGGLSTALDRPAFRRQFMDLFNESPAVDLLGHQLADLAVVNPSDPQQLQALGMDPRQAELFMQQHGGGERIVVPLIDNGEQFVPVDGPDGSIEAFSDLESWDYLQSVVTSPEVFGNAMADARGQERLGGEISIGAGGPGRGNPLAEGVDLLWDNMIQLESGGRQHDGNGNPLTSLAGAVGIAQVMPDTAPEAARMAGLEWDEDLYRNDPEYNEALGRAYLNHQIEQYGDPMLAAAAYNAGPGRVNQWLKTYGDPRRGEISRENFAASIPFAETRNYVQRALEGVEVAPTRQERQQQQREQEMPISTGALAALTPEAIQSAQQVAAGPAPAPLPERMAEWASDASQGHQGGVLGTPAGQFTEAATEAATTPPVVDPGPQLGFSPEEFQSALARRVANDQPLNGGSGKRVLGDETAMDELGRAATPERYQQAGQEFLGGLQASSDGTTYRVQQSNNRPTGKQISQAVMLHAARPDLVSAEDVRRFIDTGTFTADGVGLIERGMAEAAGTARTQIQQDAQTDREWASQMGQTERTRLQQEGQTARAQRDERVSPSQFLDTADRTFEAYARSQLGMSDREVERVKSSFQGAMLELSRWDVGPYRGGEWDVADLTMSQMRLYEKNDEIRNSSWFRTLREGGRWTDLRIGGASDPEIHRDPVAVALGTQNPMMFETTRGVRQYVHAKERYRDMMNGAGMVDQLNNRELEAKVMLITDHILRAEGGSWDSDVDRDAAMRYAMTELELLTQ